MHVIEFVIYLFFLQIKHLSSIISAARYLPKQEIQKRQNHTKKERVRRNEMRQAFTALQEALNIEEGVKMCRHDILNQVSNIS